MKKFMLLVPFVCLFLQTELCNAKEPAGADSGISIRIPLLGRSGVEMSGDKIKICPGFAFNCCAVIVISFNVAEDYVAASKSGTARGSIPVRVDVNNDDGQVVETLYMDAEILSPERFSGKGSLSGLKEDDIVLIP